MFSWRITTVHAAVILLLCEFGHACFGALKGKCIGKRCGSQMVPIAMGMGYEITTEPQIILGHHIFSDPSGAKEQIVEVGQEELKHYVLDIEQPNNNVYYKIEPLDTDSMDADDLEELLSRPAKPIALLESTLTKLADTSASKRQSIEPLDTDSMDADDLEELLSRPAKPIAFESTLTKLADTSASKRQSAMYELMANGASNKNEAAEDPTLGTGEDKDDAKPKPEFPFSGIKFQQSNFPRPNGRLRPRPSASGYSSSVNMHAQRPMTAIKPLAPAAAPKRQRNRISNRWVVNRRRT